MKQVEKLLQPQYLDVCVTNVGKVNEKVYEHQIFGKRLVSRAEDNTKDVFSPQYIEWFLN